MIDTSRCTRTTKTSNPGKRAIHEWLKDGRVPFVELTWCKRCGENVCQFISEAFPFAKNFKTDTAVAPNTWFWHVFYNGDNWEAQNIGTSEASRGMGKGKGKGKKGKGDSRHVGWHKDLFGALMAMVAQDVKYARAHGRGFGQFQSESPDHLPLVAVGDSCVHDRQGARRQVVAQRRGLCPPGFQRSGSHGFDRARSPASAVCGLS